MKEGHTHEPVLLTEVLAYLNIQAEGTYVDGTFGRGGHSRALLAQLGPQGTLIALDRDPAAVRYAQEQSVFTDKRFKIWQADFARLTQIVMQADCLGKVNGILLDLGVSSPQLENAARGFSFLRAGPLDMRMDLAQSLTAAEWLNTAQEEEMRQVFQEYGEERYARRIAAAIVQARAQAPLQDTAQLAAIVAAAHPQWERHKHPATRVFQAIRLHINQELQQLEQVLAQCERVLAPAGRLLVISFHSLEDRMVKRWIQQSPFFKKIAKVKPSAAEIAVNPRARSALLRVAEKIK